MIKMNENNETALTSAEPVKEEKKSFCTLTESIFAVIFLFVGYFFIKLFLMNSCGISAAVYLEAILVCSALLAHFRKASGSKFSRIYFALSAVFSLGIGITSSGYLQFMDFCFAAVFYAMWAFALNNPEWHGFGSDTFRSVKEAVFGSSARNFGACPKAAAGLFRNGSKNIGYVLIGLVISLPVTAIVCGLLISADRNFENMFENLLRGISIEEPVIFILGLPVSFLIFSIIFTAVNARGKLRLTESFYAKNAPPALICAFVLPLCAVYILFFFSQLGYFLSAFGGVLPEGLSASEYARRGFFELCAVAVINLGVIALINLIAADGKTRKVLTVILSVFTLILIATAQSKMFLYIKEYGLTPKRVYTSWFMFILAAVFALIIIYCFKKFRAAKIGAAIITGAALMLGFCGVDSLIARYDASLIEQGIMSEFPDDLSADAAAVISGYQGSENAALSKAAENYFEDTYAKAYYRKEWFERTASDLVTISKNKHNTDS